VHECVNEVAVLIVGNSDDTSRGNRRVLFERSLQLGEIHIGTARDDHVVLPVGEVEVPVLVQGAEVADGLPVIIGGHRRGADVAIGAAVVLVASHPNLSDLAGG